VDSITYKSHAFKTFGTVFSQDGSHCIPRQRPGVPVLLDFVSMKKGRLSRTGFGLAVVKDRG
jgi:hypothetical protein